MLFRKILLIITFFVFNLALVNAETKLILNVDKSEINLDESFQLTVEVNNDGSGVGGTIDIKGIENFYNIGKRSSSNFYSINGKTTQSQKIILGYYANNIGEFELGPATLGSGTGIIESNIISIKVNPEEKLVKKEITNNKNKSTEEKITSTKEKNEKLTKKEEIKGLEKYLFNFSVYNLIFILIFIIFSFLIYIFSKENKIEKSEIKIKEVKNYYQIINNKINYLKNNYKDLSKPKFYSLLNNALRIYFESIGIKNSMTLTLEEIITLKIDKDILNLFKETYYYEFNTQEDNNEYRLKLINNIKELIKKC